MGTGVGVRGLIQTGPPQSWELSTAEAGKGLGKGHLSERSLWHLSPCPSILQANYFPGHIPALQASVTLVWLSGEEEGGTLKVREEWKCCPMRVSD